MILVKNKELLLSNREQYLGTDMDNNSAVRTFQIPRISIDGVDIADLSFRINAKRTDKEPDSFYLEKEIREDEIILTWTIKQSVLAEPGTMFINIRAHDDTGDLRWASYQAPVYVEGTTEEPVLPSGQLTELEELERAIDKNNQAIMGSEASRRQAETEREAAEQARREAEIAREEKTSQVIQTFDKAISEADRNAKLAQSYAVGNSGIRNGENTDNAEYYSRMAELNRGRAEAAQKAAEQAQEDVIERLNAGEFTGPEGPQGPPGEQGKSGISIPANCLLYIYTDDSDNSAIHCVYDDAVFEQPPIQYRESDGAILWQYNDGH